MNSRIFKCLEVVSVLFLIYFSDLRNDPLGLENFLRLISYPITLFLIIRQSLSKLTYIVTRDWLLLFLHFFAISSFFWSVNPVESFDQLKALIRTFLIGIYIATSYSPKEQMRLLRWVLSATAILSLLASIFIPSWGTAPYEGSIVWQGIYSHKQYLARAMAIGSMISVLALCKSKKYWLQKISILILQLVLIYKANSKTAIVLFLLSILIIPIYNIAKQKFRIREIIIIIIFMLSSLLCILLFSNIETLLVDVLNKNLELNGRTPLWEGVVRVALQRPWLGYGYSAFWDSPQSWEAIKHTWISQIENKPHAHNGYVDMFAELGFIGLILFSIHCFILFSKIIRILFINPNIEYVWMLEMVVLMLFYNFVEVNSILKSSFIWIYYISISLSVTIELEVVTKQSFKLNNNLLKEQTVN